MDPRLEPGPRVDVARFYPLPVGIVAWSAPEPRLTVVVKATFTIAADGIAELATEQEPLTLDRPFPRCDDGDLEAASDFAPRKARADVLLAGSAHAHAPMHTLTAGFAVDGMR